MIEVVGAYNTAFCYTGELEEAAAGQIKAVCDQSAFADCKIRIMPDVHAGMGCTIGTTMTITDKIVPGMVGVDIGCGMETVRIAEKEIDFVRLDEIIHKYIPCGREVRKQLHKLNDQINLTQLRCSPYVNLSRAQRSIGTLGGGNHFIEVDRGENGDLFIVVHSGSRHIGNEVAKYYQDEGRKAFWGGARHQVDAAVAELKAQGRFQEIQPTINRLRKEHEISLPKDLAYVEGKLFDDYIHDMKIIQRFATLNRKAMMDVILVGMRLTAVEQFTTIHNYIDTDNMILRKGAVAAYEGQKLLIPINMRDGSLICVGKGNPEWNCSAPHGAGRLMSRKEAFKRLSLDEYRKEMEGIYTTCVDRTTLDEAPMDKFKKIAIRKQTMLPFIVAMIAALVMVVCVFLPYATATEARAEWIDKYPDSMALEEMGLTAADMKDISMAKFAHIYSTMSEEYWSDSFVGVFYIVLVALIGGGSLVAALFALGRKPIGCIIFGAISFGVFYMLNWDFTDRGVIPSDSYDWGIAHTLFPIAAVLLLVGAIWMFVKKVLAKKQFAAEISKQATEVR